MHAVRRLRHALAALVRERHLAEARTVEVTQVLDLINRPDVLVELHVDNFRDFCAATGTVTRVTLFLAGLLGLAALGCCWFDVFGVLQRDGLRLLGFVVLLAVVFLLGDVALLEREAVRHVRRVHEHRILLVRLAIRAVAAVIIGHLLHLDRL